MGAGARGQIDRVGEHDKKSGLVRHSVLCGAWARAHELI